MLVSKGNHSLETWKHGTRYGENRKMSIVFNDMKLAFGIEIHLRI